MTRKSVAAQRKRAEALRATIRQRSGVFCGSAMGLMALARGVWGTAEMPVVIFVIAGTSFVTFFWLRRRWMREYREALTAAGIDPERDELVENAAGFKSTMLILFGVFGGMFVFLAVFVWLARR